MIKESVFDRMTHAEKEVAGELFVPSIKRMIPITKYFFFIFISSFIIFYNNVRL